MGLPSRQLSSAGGNSTKTNVKTGEYTKGKGPVLRKVASKNALGATRAGEQAAMPSQNKQVSPASNNRDSAISAIVDAFNSPFPAKPANALPVDGAAVAESPIASGIGSRLFGDTASWIPKPLAGSIDDIYRTVGESVSWMSKEARKLFNGGGPSFDEEGTSSELLEQGHASAVNDYINSTNNFDIEPNDYKKIYGYFVLYDAQKQLRNIQPPDAEPREVLENWVAQRTTGRIDELVSLLDEARRKNLPATMTLMDIVEKSGIRGEELYDLFTTSYGRNFGALITGLVDKYAKLP